MFIADLKLIFESYKSNFISLSISLIGLPLFLVFIMSMISTDSFAHEPENLEIPIQILDHDQTTESNEIVQMLHALSAQGIVQLKEDASTQIVIPEGYKDALDRRDAIDIPIQTGADYSYYEVTILQAVLEMLTSAQQEKINFDQLTSAQNLNAKELEEIEQIWQNITQSGHGKIEIVEPTQELSAREYFSVNYLQFIFFMLVGMLMVGAKQAKETTDLEARTELTPHSSLKKMVMKVITTAIEFYIFGLLYILIVHILGWGFQGNLLQHGVSLLPIVFIFAGFGTILTEIVPKKFAILVYQLMNIAVLFVGGLLPPMGFLKGTFLNVFAGGNLLRATIQPFLQTMLGTFHWQNLIPYFIFATVLFGMSVVILSVVERVKA